MVGLASTELGMAAGGNRFLVKWGEVFFLLGEAMLVELVDCCCKGENWDLEGEEEEKTGSG